MDKSELLLRQLKIARQEEDKQTELILLGELGNLYFSSNELDRAIAFYDQALGISTSIKNRQIEGATLNNLGNAYAASGSSKLAIESYNRALSIAQNIKDNSLERDILDNLHKVQSAPGTSAGSLGGALGSLQLPSRYFGSWMLFPMTALLIFLFLTLVVVIVSKSQIISSTPWFAIISIIFTVVGVVLGLITLIVGLFRERPLSQHSKVFSNSFFFRKLKIFSALTLILITAGIVLTTGYLTIRPSTSTACNQTIQAENGECVGLSDGAFAFDTARQDGDLKRQAANKLRDGDTSGAITLWEQAAAVDSNDAEALIYMEDQRVLATKQPYITIVVGTVLTGTRASVGRANLQGAYILQKEYNDGYKLRNRVPVRLLIANAGTNAVNTTLVARQITQAAQEDKSIVGVMGWPFSSYTLNAASILSTARIPMVSPSASSDVLTGVSPYFFRIVPPDSQQGTVGANYAEKILHAKRAVVFVDINNVYSASLANDFSATFRSLGGTVVTINYTVGQGKDFPLLSRDALNYQPDIIYFAGYADDVEVLLSSLGSNIPILGSDALYELGGYPQSAYGRINFTVLAYPDTWSLLGLPQHPAFFSEYAKAFDPNGQHQSSPYGYSRPDSDAILSYDAMLTLMNGIERAFAARGTGFTPNDLQQALTTITGTQSIQGISGQISFDPTGNPVNKTILVFSLNSRGQYKIRFTQGKFLVS